MAKRKSKFAIDEADVIDSIADTTSSDTTAPDALDPAKDDDKKAYKKNMNPKSLANLHPREFGKSPKQYMQLNIYGYDDYLKCIAKSRKMTKTKYILDLIRKDKEMHEEEYKQLKALEALRNK